MKWRNPGDEGEILGMRSKMTNKGFELRGSENIIDDLVQMYGLGEAKRVDTPMARPTAK